MAWSSTLGGDVGERDTVLGILSTPDAPSGASLYLTIGDEIVRVYGIGDRSVNVERGALGTDPTPHAAGAIVERYKSPKTSTAEAGPHTHPYADTVHVHPGYSGTAHAHAGGDHPDLASHEALGLATPHNHDFAATVHAHGTAAHLHDYASPGHNHDAAYSGTGHAHGTVAHAHLYADPAHAHDLSAYSGTAHTHAAYSGTAHTHAGGGANVKSGAVNLTAGGSAVVTFTTPFASTPHVVVTNQFSSADTSTTLSVFPVSTTGFTIRGAGNAAGTVAWIATNAGNP
jgi:hypothetical protein